MATITSGDTGCGHNTSGWDYHNEWQRYKGGGDERAHYHISTDPFTPLKAYPMTYSEAYKKPNKKLLLL